MLLDDIFTEQLRIDENSLYANDQEKQKILGDSHLVADLFWVNVLRILGS